MTTQPRTSSTSGRRPSHRAWLVIDRPDTGKPQWKELTGLWPTKKGSGLSGNVNQPLTLADGFLMGRLVVLPARMNPEQDHHDGQGGEGEPEPGDD